MSHAPSSARRALRGVGLLVIVVLGAAAVAPALLKDRVLGTLQAEINAQILADVHFQDASLTAFTSFPDLTVSLTGVSVVNRAPFEGVKLAEAGRLDLTLDLMSVLGGEQIIIRELRLEDAALDLRVNAEGESNTDITAKEADVAQEVATAEASAVGLKLAAVQLHRVDLRYDDRVDDQVILVDDLELVGSGDLAAARSELKGRTEIARLSVEKGGIPLLREVRLSWELIGAIERGVDARDVTVTETRVSLVENRIVLNDLHVELTGGVLLGEDGAQLDLELKNAGSSLKNLLSLVPAVYSGAYADVASAGTLSLAGTLRGLLPSEGDHLPVMDLRVGIENGSFQLPDVPVPLTAVTLDLRVTHPGGAPDGLVLEAARFAMTVDTSPLEGRFLLRTPISDPEVALVAKGRLDLARLGQVVPLEGASLKGEVDMDIDVEGRVSQFTAEGAQNVKAKGFFSAKGLVYAGAAVPDPVRVESLRATLSPAVVELTDTRLRIGESDMTVQARLENVLGYSLAGQTLGGAITLSAERLDLDRLTGEPEPGEAEAEAEGSVTVIPANLALRVETRLGTVRYDSADYHNVVGAVTIADSTLTFEDLSLDLLGGRAGVRGTYRAPTAARADIDLTVKAEALSIAETASRYQSFQRVVPLAEGLGGTYSGSARFVGTLGPDLAPDLPSLFSEGDLRITGVALAPAALAAVGSAMKDDSFTRLKLDGRRLAYVLRGGELEPTPMALTVGGVEASLQGGFDPVARTLALEMGMTVPTSRLAPGVLNLGAGAPVDLDVVVDIGGTYDSPKVAVKPGKVTVAVVAAVVGSLVDAARSRGDALIAAAEKEAAALRAAARAEAEKLRKEARKKVDEQLKAAKGNPLLEKAARKVVDELEKKAEEAIRKADKKAEEKADTVVTKARKEKERLIAEAEQKASAP